MKWVQLGENHEMVQLYHIYSLTYLSNTYSKFLLGSVVFPRNGKMNKA